MKRPSLLLLMALPFILVVGFLLWSLAEVTEAIHDVQRVHDEAERALDEVYDRDPT